MMKFDKTIGWVSKRLFENSSAANGFEVPFLVRKQPQEFLENWRGVKYVFGGVSKAGIDCSGFIQKFFLEVEGGILPKNSRDQRKACCSKENNDFENRDLIFCHRKGSDMHHVALFFDDHVWHARPKYGVVSQTVDEFRDLFDIECVATV
jgi:lipoprotein Spr